MNNFVRPQSATKTIKQDRVRIDAHIYILQVYLHKITYVGVSISELTVCVVRLKAQYRDVVVDIASTTKVHG